MGEAGCRPKMRQDVSTGEAGCHPKLRQDVAAHLFAHHKTACLLTLSPLACHQAACSEPVKRRFRQKSGRRDSNPRQPAWKAGTLPSLLGVLAPFVFRLKSLPSCLIGSRHTRRQVITRAEFTLLRLHIDVVQVHIVLHSTDILVPQHLLKAEDVPSEHEVAYREGMPEDMRCDPAVREV